MQVGHGHNRALELSVARRKRYERSCGYWRVVGISGHDRGIDRKHVGTTDVIDVVNEDAMVTRSLEGWSGCLEYRLNVGQLAGAGGVHLTTVSINLRLGESRRQDLLENYVFRDLIERDVSAKRRIEFRSNGDEDRWPGQLVHELGNDVGIQGLHAEVSGPCRHCHPVLHVPMRVAFGLARCRDRVGGLRQQDRRGQHRGKYEQSEILYNEEKVSGLFHWLLLQRGPSLISAPKDEREERSSPQGLERVAAGPFWKVRSGAVDFGVDFSSALGNL